MSEAPHHLVAKGGRWYHTPDHPPGALNMSRKCLGDFFHEVLRRGGHIGEVWPFNHRYDRTLVKITVCLTPAMKADLEKSTRFRFEDPPRIELS